MGGVGDSWWLRKYRKRKLGTDDFSSVVKVKKCTKLASDNDHVCVDIHIRSFYSRFSSLHIFFFCRRAWQYSTINRLLLTYLLSIPSLLSYNCHLFFLGKMRLGTDPRLIIRFSKISFSFFQHLREKSLLSKLYNCSYILTVETIVQIVHEYMICQIRIQFWQSGFLR